MSDPRQALLDRLADHVLAHGLSQATLRPLARAAGTSDRMLLYYFRDKSEILSATLDHLSARLMALLSERAGPPRRAEALWDDLAPVVLSPELWPYMRLWLDIATRAAQGDAFWRDRGRAVGLGFLDWIAAQIDAPTPEDRATEAARLMTRLDGLMIFRAVGLDEVVRRVAPDG